MRTCDAAVAVLRETGNPAVMWGDSGLLDDIAKRAGTKDGHPLNRWKRVLDALTRQPGELVAGLTSTPDGRINLRIFYLPEHVPEWSKK